MLMPGTGARGCCLERTYKEEAIARCASRNAVVPRPPCPLIRFRQIQQRTVVFFVS